MKATKRKHLKVIDIKYLSYRIHYLKNTKMDLMYKVVISEKTLIAPPLLWIPWTRIILNQRQNNEPTTRW